MAESTGEFFQLLVKIPIARPYVAAFFVTFLFAITAHFGARRTMLYGVVAFTLALAAEMLSIRTGLPFGDYVYFYDIIGDRDLVIGGIPAFSTLSFVFLIYVAYSMAIFLSRPFIVRGLRVEFVDRDAAPRTARVRVLAALLHVAMDITTDPVSYHGDKWFLGELWEYRTPAFFLGIPLTNFLAWVVLALVVLAVYHRLEELGERRGWLPERRSGPFSPRLLLGPCCYLGVFAFILSISLWLAFTWKGPENREFVLLSAMGIVAIGLLGRLFLSRWAEGRERGRRAPASAPPESSRSPAPPGDGKPA